MDQGQLLQALQYTLDPSSQYIKQAESYLLQVCFQLFS